MKKSLSLFIAILIVINIFTGIPFSIIAFAEEVTDGEASQENSLISLSSEVADVQEEVEAIINNYDNIAEDFDENVYTAEYISNGEINQLLNNYMNKENPSRQMINYLNGKTFYKAMREVWEDANFYTDPVGTTFDKLYKTSYYTALLLKLIDATYEDDSFTSIVDRKAIKSALEYRKQFIDSADSILGDKYILQHIHLLEAGIEDQESIKEAAKRFTSKSLYHFGEDEINLVDEVMKGVDTFEEIYSTLGTYAAICEVKQSTIDFLENMRNHTNNVYLREAINEVVTMHNDSFLGLIRNGAIGVVKSVTKSKLKGLFSGWKDTLVSGLKNGTLSVLSIDPIALSIQITKKIGNMAFSVDEKLDKAAFMEAICKIEEAAKGTINESISRFVTNKDASTGAVLVSGVKVLFNAYLKDTELYTEFVQICQKDWVSNISEEEFAIVLNDMENNRVDYTNGMNQILPHTGKCGDHICWYFGGTGTLILIGYGDMNNYTETSVPWKQYKNEINELYVDDYISKIGQYAFYGFELTNKTVAVNNSIELSEYSVSDSNIDFVCGDDLIVRDATFNGNTIKAHNDLSLYNIDSTNCSYSCGKKLQVNNGTYNQNSYYGSKIHFNGIVFKGRNQVFGEAYLTGTSRELTRVINGSSLNIDGNLTVEGQNKYLFIDEGSSVNVSKNLVANLGGYIPPQITLNGKLFVNADADLSNCSNVNGGKLIMSSGSSEFTVCGNLLGLATSSTSSITNGTLNLHGDVNVTGSLTGTAIVNICGNYKQEIQSLDTSNLRIANTSEEGVVIQNKIYVRNSIESDINSKILSGRNIVLSGFIINKYVGDITINNSWSKMTGKTDIVGDVYFTGTGRERTKIPADSTLNIDGNVTVEGQSEYLFIDSGAMVTVSKNFIANLGGYIPPRITLDGKLIVNGNADLSNCSNVNGGKLIMTKDTGVLTVRGNLIGLATSTNPSITNGTLNLSGDVTIDGSVSENAVVNICGNKKQIIHKLDTPNLKISNTSSEGVVIENNIYVRNTIESNLNSKISSGKKIVLSGTIINKYVGDITIRNSVSKMTGNIDIVGDVFLTGTDREPTIIPSGTTLNIDGNVSVDAMNRFLTIDKGASVVVSGNFIDNQSGYIPPHITLNGALIVNGNADLSNCNSNGGKLIMKSDESVFTVYGNLIGFGASYADCAPSVSNGTLNFYGDVNISGKIGENAIVNICGNTKQNVSATNFCTLVIDNTNSEGVVFSKEINISYLFNHKGNIFTLYNNGKGSSFVDYDGDGLKDNVDPNPVVGNPCTISVQADDNSHGSASSSYYDTFGGTEVTITATPNDKYLFMNWVDENGKAVSSNCSYTFIAKSDKCFTAFFSKRTRNIYVDTNNGYVFVPSIAEIESAVDIDEIIADDGYVFEEGSLKYNNQPINNNSFVMPDEDVVITASFVRNEYYFSLLESLNNAESYLNGQYTESSLSVLEEAINYGYSRLKNDISQSTSNECIEIINLSINSLVCSHIDEDGNGICDVCGEIVSTFAGHSLTLNGDIGVNFYLNLTDDQIDKEVAIAFSWFDKTETLYLTSEDKKSGLFKAACHIAPAEMTYDITATVIVDGEVQDETDTYSAQKYADYILNDTNGFQSAFVESENKAGRNGQKRYQDLIILVKTMLDYGSKAQLTFNRDVEHPANGGTDYYNDENSPVDADSISVTEKNMDADLSAFGLSYKGSTVVYLSEVSIRHYFDVTNMDLFDGVKDSVVFDDLSVTYTEKDGAIYFEKKNIEASQIDTPYVLNINGVSLEYAVNDYVRHCLTSAKVSDNTKALVKATYRYNQAANEFFLD